MDTVRFSVPNGFRHERTASVLPLDDAVALLVTKKQRRYTRAVRRGEQAELIRDRVVCPCGAHTPAYAPFVPSDPDMGGDGIRIPAPEVRSWADNLSLFPDDDVLVFHGKGWNGQSFTCPRCSLTSRAFSSSTEAEIRVEKGLVCFTVFDAAADVAESLLAAARKGVRLCFPLRETLCLAGGKAWLTVYDAGDRPLRIRDVTEPNEHWLRSEACLLLTRSVVARRKLLQALSLFWEGPLPFTAAQLTDPAQLLSLSRFRGFPRSFYDMLPTDGAGALEPGFRAAARKLRSLRRLPALFDASGLPGKKSVRRHFFAHPELFWFLREARVLWELVGDVNLFCAVLNKSCCFELLAALHAYPGAEVFLRDYAARKGAGALVELAGRYEDLEKALAYAIGYAAAGEPLRRREQKRWKDRRYVFQSSLCASPAAVLPALRTRDRTVDGFRFVWLRTKEAFNSAGRALRNCLGEYSPATMTAAVIRQDGRSLAAVEVSKNCIVQALGAHNTPLDPEGAPGRALAKWAELCGFWLPPPGEEDDDLLPF